MGRKVSCLREGLLAYRALVGFFSVVRPQMRLEGGLPRVGLATNVAGIIPGECLLGPPHCLEIGQALDVCGVCRIANGSESSLRRGIRGSMGVSGAGIREGMRKCWKGRYPSAWGFNEIVRGVVSVFFRYQRDAFSRDVALVGGTGAATRISFWLHVDFSTGGRGHRHGTGLQW